MAGDFTATDYEEVQILKAGFGMGPSIPTNYYLGVSMTAINDDGTGLTEFSGSNYTRVKVRAWSPATLDMLGPYPNPPYSCRTHSLDTLQFPNPSAQWWVIGTRVAPFLADAASGGNVRWHADLGGMPRIYPNHPLTFSTPGVQIGLGGGFQEPVFCPTWRNGALNTLTGAASYSGPPTLYIAWVKGVAWNYFSEPSQSYGPNPPPFGPYVFGDPNYTRLALGSLTTPATQGDGRGGASNANDKSWTVTAGHHLNWSGGYYPVVLDDPTALTDADVNSPYNRSLLNSIPNGWPVAGYPVAPTAVGNLWFGKWNSDPVPSSIADGDQILIPAGCLKFRDV